MTNEQRRQIAEILSRRANEIASFATDYRSDPRHWGSVELALTREISRLRELADAVLEDETKENDDA